MIKTIDKNKKILDTKNDLYFYEIFGRLKMASAIMNKVWNLLGMEPAEDGYEDENENIYENDYYDDDEQEPIVEEKRSIQLRINYQLLTMN